MRIAIVNDTSMISITLQKIIESDKNHTVSWIAENGADAIERYKEDPPDLILMDIIMPIMDGVETTREIMNIAPCAILLVTSSVDGNASKVFDAMGAGALDAINTPIFDETDNSKMGKTLLERINIINKLIIYDNVPQVKKPSETVNTNETTTLITIGSSTGGPDALVKVLKDIPLNIPAAFIIIQHIDKQFINGFVSWLNDQISLPVQIAKEGDSIKVGTVLVAKSEQHLSLTKNQTLTYTSTPEDCPYKPSVNVFFDSVAKNRLENSIGILLTGMGKDGATGLLSMKEKGFTTIAQEQSSCAVYGMPKAAIDINAEDLKLSPIEINKKIMQSFIGLSKAI